MFTGYKDAELKKVAFTIEADIAHYRNERGIPMRKNIKVLKDE